MECSREGTLRADREVDLIQDLKYDFHANRANSGGAKEPCRMTPTVDRIAASGRRAAAALLIAAALLGASRSSAQDYLLDPDRSEAARLELVERHDPVVVRKTRSGDVAFTYEKRVLRNGLTVLLHRDPTMQDVVVDLGFRAGTLFEPPGKSGLAHLVEHVLYAGSTPDTDYPTLLALHGAREVNAFTDQDRMTFRAVVPSGELGFVFWLNAERLGALTGRLTQEEVERNRRIVEAERAMRYGDTPYALLAAETFRRAFPAPHPLHGGVIGLPEQLATVTSADVLAFARHHLMPANGILTLVGNFDPERVPPLLEESLERLPAGERAVLPLTATVMPYRAGEFRLHERVGRRGRTQLVWSLPFVPAEESDALEIGAMLLRLLGGNIWGQSVSASFSASGAGALFTVDVTSDGERSAGAHLDTANGLMRLLTRSAIPDELMDVSFLLFDLSTLRMLDSATRRASLLTEFEHAGYSPAEISGYTERHWRLNGDRIRLAAIGFLDRPRMVFHVTPERPLPRRQALELPGREDAAEVLP